MGRWVPGAEARLQRAAMELFLEHGYGATTVADISDRAGVTSRTFFRYFGDKREVLFGGSRFQESLVGALQAAPASAAPMQAVEAAFAVVDDLLPPRQYAALRQSVIDSDPELQERELIKLAGLSTALAVELRARGADDPDLVAEAAVAVFRVAFARWLSGPDGRSLSEVVREAFASLRVLART